MKMYRVLAMFLYDACDIACFVFGFDGDGYVVDGR
jgi:hypothetical protein